MAQVIGIIKLAPGEVGFYDELSKIHLTMSRPKANVYDYMNTSRLVRGVRSRVLVLVAGSLNAIREVQQEQPEIKKEELAVEEPIVNVAEELVQEEIVEIKQPIKKSTKKKKKEEE